MRAGRSIGRIEVISAPRREAYLAVTGGAGLRSAPSYGAVFDLVWSFVDARSEEVSIALSGAVLWRARR